MAAGWLRPMAPSAFRQEPLSEFAQTSFEFDPAVPLVAHTDEACSGNPGPGGWAVVFSQGGKVVAEFSGPSVGDSTNNRMELTAVLEALRRAPPGTDLEIATDSGNVIGWLSGCWKRKDEGIANLCAEIDPLLEGRRVSFRKVPGHQGDPLNELVDKLAVEALKTKRAG
jgi:ribonuclease HI